MGSVFRALDRELDEEVALKILRPELAATQDALVRFRREVKLARRVTHTNVARTYDLGEHDGIRFLTMELILGASLRQLVQHGLPDVLRIAHEVALGLAAAHAVGVVHRDLKPDNVMIASDRVVITDFGIARTADASDALQTSGNIVGTPAYIAPEQLEGANVDGRADIFALGVMLYELLAGKLPFEGTGSGIAYARLVRMPTPLGDVAPGVPEGVARLVMDALARQREERPDAHTFAARLAVLRGGGRAESQVRMVATAELVTVATQRTVRVAELDADAATRALAGDLASAIADGLAKEPSIRVLKAGPAEETIEATVRASGDQVRVRLRLVDARGDTLWADRVDGRLADPFALEDAVCDRALAALRARASLGGGPPGPLRARYEQARADLGGQLPMARTAVAALEELDREAPDDPWIMSLLACAHVQIALATGAEDAAAFGRAEELALRALDRDPTNGQAFYAIAVIRSIKGDHAGAIGAARETLRRLPLHAEAHFQIGRVLCWANRIAEGLPRLELAIRLAPTNFQVINEKIRVLALLGDRAGAERELLHSEKLHRGAQILPRLRLFAWWEDRALAREAADLLAGDTSGGAWQAAQPLIDAYARGDTPAMLEAAMRGLPVITSARVVARQRGMMHEIATEYFMLCGADELATEHITQLGVLPSFIDLLWLDRCPILVRLHKTAAFAQARAAVAARVAQLFG